MTEDQFKNLKEQMNPAAAEGRIFNNTALNKDITEFKKLTMDDFKENYIQDVIIHRKGRLSEIARDLLEQQPIKNPTLLMASN